MADTDRAGGNKPEQKRTWGSIPVFVGIKPDSIKSTADRKVEFVAILGQNHGNPSFPVQIKVTIDGVPNGVFKVKDNQEQKFTAAPDSTKGFIEVKVEKAGDPKNFDKVSVPVPQDLKPPAKSAEEAPPKAEAKQPATFVINAALSPDKKGWFLVEISSTGTDGKPSNQIFGLLANQPIKVRVEETGSRLKGHAIPLATENGKLTTLVAFDKDVHEVQLTFRPQELPEQRALLVR
jgi:hypothetical protein